MKRLMVEGRYTQTITRTVNGEGHTLSASETEKLVVDISPDIKSWNPNL